MTSTLGWALQNWHSRIGSSLFVSLSLPLSLHLKRTQTLSETWDSSSGGACVNLLASGPVLIWFVGDFNLTFQWLPVKRDYSPNPGGASLAGDHFSEMADFVELFDSKAQRTAAAHRCASNDSVVEDEDDNNDNDYGNMQVFTVRFISSQIYFCTQPQGAWFMRMLS